MEKAVFFDATPSEILVTNNRYAIASVPLNSVTDKRKVVFCESVGLSEGYGAGRGIELSEIQGLISTAVEVAKEFIEAVDTEVERILKL